eukprot:TRINITY_DN34659_c0_g1_i3.p1 TRINITY_DN34659_c0_g1~~TRINITY_DN34659_c0_g1_i3.p1  ORF type:complete len:222 (+),score=4.55 TRINITY_DN34659_c0_g1_i3:217-882(+)
MGHDIVFNQKSKVPTTTLIVKDREHKHNSYQEFIKNQFKTEQQVMQTVLIILGTLAGAFVILNIYARMKMKKTPLVDDHEGILTLTEKNFQQQTKNKVVLVDFWAAWCALCRMMAPVLNDVSAGLSGNSAIGKINIEEQQALAQRFSVRSIPTLILFKNGKEIKRFVGIKQKEFLLNEIKSAAVQSITGKRKSRQVIGTIQCPVLYFSKSDLSPCPLPGRG